MQVRIIDTVGRVLFTVNFNDDQFALLACKGWIFIRNIGGLDAPYMNNTRLIEAITEMSI
jgi:hypothetical protein